MKQRIRNAYHWCVNRLPEALLILCLLSVIPALFMGGVALMRQFSMLAGGPSDYAEWFTSHPWTVTATFICLVTLAGLASVLWRERQHLWPVARKMIVEAMHRKVVIILLVFFVVLIPVMPFILETQGSMKSQVQITFTYAMGLAEALLCFLAIFLGTASVCREIEQRNVHITDTKPMGRWKFLAGKLAGIVIMCSALLFVMMLGVYGLVTYLSVRPNVSGLQDWQVQQLQRERREVMNQVFTARTSVRPPRPEVEDRVEQEINELKNNGNLTQEFRNEQEARMQLSRRFMQQALSVPPGGVKAWTLSGLSPPSQTGARWVYLRFKVFSPGTQEGGTVDGAWTILQPRQQGEDNGGKAKQKGRRQMVPLGTVRRDWNAGSFQELRVPAQAVTPEGKLYLRYQNLERGSTVIFELGRGLEAMQEVGRFFPNFYRSVVVIMFHIILLAALGLMAGSMFSFPVASLLVTFIFFLGISAPWFDALWQTVPTAFTFEGNPALTYLLNRALNALMTGVLTVVPNVSTYSPIGDLVHGRLVSWAFVCRTGALMVAVKGGAVMLLATYAYYRRELARVIV